MIYKEQIEKIVKETVEYTVAPCIKFSNDIYAGNGIDHVKDENGKRIDIELYNIDRYSSNQKYNMYSGGICHKCGHDVCEQYGKWKSDASYIWNKNNDISSLIALQQVNIKLANDEIKRLSDLDKERKTLSK